MTFSKTLCWQFSYLIKHWTSCNGLVYLVLLWLVTLKKFILSNPLVLQLSINFTIYSKLFANHMIWITVVWCWKRLLRQNYNNNNSQVRIRTLDLPVQKRGLYHWDSEPPTIISKWNCSFSIPREIKVRIIALVWNKASWRNVLSHLMCWNQSECFISE